MKFKNISKLLTIGILLNNISINSFAGVLSDDTRYETFTGNNINIHDILEEDKVDVEIEGNSLVNLLENVEWKPREGYFYNNNVIHSISNKTLTLVNLSDKNLTLSLNSGDIEGFNGAFYRNVTIPKNSFITEKISSNECLRTFLGFISDGWNEENYSKELMNKLIVLEGSYDYDTVPKEYFEGIKSVGESEDENHNITITSQSKNLLNKDELLYGVGINGAGPDGATSTTGIQVSYPSRASTDFIPIKPGSTLNFKSFDGKISTRLLLFYNENKEYIGEDSVANYALDWVSNIPDNAKYIRILFLKNDGTDNTGTFYSPEIVNESKIMLSYEPINEYQDYCSDTITINLKTPLRGLPDGTRDKIIKLNGKWYIERNCAELIVNLNKDKYTISRWNDNRFDTSNLYAYYMSNSTILGIFEDQIYKTGSLLSDKFQNIGDVGNDKEGACSALSALPPYIGFKIQKAIIDSQEGDSLEKKLENYLKSLGDMTFILKLKNPTYELLDINSSIHLYLDTTYITNNSNVPASMTVTVDRVLNRATEYTKLAKINPTVENVSQARMWINMIDDSSKKDQLQNEINNIVDISDLEIEKKSVSANVDIYIKSKNTLSMSLNTNSITFDDFSGIEDMEKQGEVEITVSSTLPYNLNAYLESEIYNSDKSNIMDKSILNIKESSKSTYQAFKNTTDKIILKENCTEGNFISHNIDLKLAGNIVHEKDVYKTTIKFEAEQK